MEQIAFSTAASLASELYSNQDVRSAISKIFHKMYKKCFYNEVECIICEDFARSALPKPVVNDQYVFANVECILKSMMSPDEQLKMRSLKVEHYDVYIMKYSKQLKVILNALRDQYRKEKTILVVLSSIEMAQKLHIKDYTVYISDEAYFNSLLERCSTEEEKNYMNYQHSKLDTQSTYMYNDINQLKLLIEKNYH